jgi:hypothetical protein
MDDNPMAVSTPDVLAECEVAYKETGNPLFVWYALSKGCRYYEPLPEWIMNYLLGVATYMNRRDSAGNFPGDDVEGQPQGLLDLAGAAHVLRDSGPTHGELPPSHPAIAKTPAHAAKLVARALGLVRESASAPKTDPIQGWVNAFAQWQDLGRARDIAALTITSGHGKLEDRVADAGSFWGLKLRRTWEDPIRIWRAAASSGFWAKLNEARRRKP